jgi:hypothetical protein
VVNRWRLDAGCTRALDARVQFVWAVVGVRWTAAVDGHLVAVFKVGIESSNIEVNKVIRAVSENVAHLNSALFAVLI